MRLERNQGEFDVLLVAVRPERWLLHALVLLGALPTRAVRLDAPGALKCWWEPPR